MKNIYKSSLIKFILTGSILLSSITACKKDYFDINTDPNHPADVPVSLLLPSAEGAIAHTLGNDMQIIGGLWSQYWTQSSAASQYKQYEQYNPAANDFDYVWAILYSDALADLKTMEVKATATGQTQFVACSKILQAYAYQLLTDNFGDIPFTEALQAEEGIIEPKYDAQSTVYDGIFRLLNEGIAMIDEDVTEATPGAPGAADIFFHGEMTMWKKFANTLKLRAYLRISEIDPGKASAGIATLSGEEFLGIAENVQINYTSAGGNTNPLYSAEVGLNYTQNLVASATMIDYYLNNNDPRVDVFYIPSSSGSHVGIAQGDYTVAPGTPVSEPSAVTGASANDENSATAPVILMSSYESLFLQAEAAARGWLAGSAQSLYEEGITESFESYGLDPADAATYIAQPSISYPNGTMQDNIKAIITQKWAAMCGNQNNEAWTEWRRTGYPDFFTTSVTALVGGMPARYYYPQTEINANSNHSPQPAFVTQRVWWDIN